MKYTLKSCTVDGCDCADCKAGKHLYELLRWKDDEWHFVGMSLLGYVSAAECKLKHYWGLKFESDDTWEDGTPIEAEESSPPKEQPSGPVEMVPLNVEALVKSMESMQRHMPK